MNETLKSLIIDIIIAVLLAGAILFFIRPTFVRQTSMLPNFEDGDYLIIYKRAYVHKEPQYGDVIVFKSSLVDESGKDKLLIKRVIGVSGDTITVKDGDVYINGDKLSENYTNDGYTPGDIKGYVVPENSYFCMGDNRVVSIDSRSPEVGAINKDQIMGKVVFRLFPFNKIGTIKFEDLQ